MARLSSIWLCSVALGLGLFGQSESRAEDLEFRDVELPTRLTVGYAVRLIDMNGDERLDIAVVDSDRILWLENPNWNEHVILEGQTKRDNVCFAPHDIDGDGHLDFAVGADWRPGDTKTGGTIQWITGGANPSGSWKLLPIGEYPVIHRMNFADLDLDGKQELIVSPLMGKDTTRPNFQEHGTPLFVYDRARFAETARAFQAALAATGLPYRLRFALKANPLPEILSVFRGLGAPGTADSVGIDVASCVAKSAEKKGGLS